jgi:hypothetical protein
MLADLVATVRSGQSRVLIVRGEPGVGKPALLDHLAGQASGHACGADRPKPPR